MTSLLTTIKDMTDEELLEALLSVFPTMLIVGALYVFVLVKVLQFFFCKRHPKLKKMLRYKDDYNLFASQKLQKYLDSCIASSVKLILRLETCPICGKTRSTIKHYESCPRCGTKLQYADDVYVLSRIPTNHKREEIYKADYASLEYLIQKYKPHRSEGGYDGGDDGGNITVNVYINK